jgi:SWI2/SNF2 ATPase
MASSFKRRNRDVSGISVARRDRKAGVIWHTQGSGKSLLMAFYSGLIIKHPEMQNPTLVVLTDRNDLDDQLFGTFSMCKDLLRQTAQQAEDRDHLRKLLDLCGLLAGGNGCLAKGVHGFTLSSQFGRTSAPIVPHFVHTIFGPNEGTVTSPGRWSTFMITSCRHR